MASWGWQNTSKVARAGGARAQVSEYSSSLLCEFHQACINVHVPSGAVFVLLNNIISKTSSEEEMRTYTYHMQARALQSMASPGPVPCPGHALLSCSGAAGGHGRAHRCSVLPLGASHLQPHQPGVHDWRNHMGIGWDLRCPMVIWRDLLQTVDPTQHMKTAGHIEVAGQQSVPFSKPVPCFTHSAMPYTHTLHP